MNTASTAAKPRTAIFALGVLFACSFGVASCASQSGPREQPQANPAPGATRHASAPKEPQARRLEFHYQATILPGAKKGPVDIFLPIAQSTPEQEVVSVDVDSPVRGEFGTETTYGNRYWHAHLDQLPEEPLTVRVTYRFARKPLVRDDIEARAGDAYSDRELDEHRLFLKANRRVPIDGEVVEKVIDTIDFDADDTLAQRARKIYDHVVDTMEYKKVGTGWGNGDTHWACSERYGNCTDFHALFTSLARHQNIPARFEIGFPVPTDRTEGNIGGYHCWVKFYLPGVGWTPIDASEAKKNPERRDEFFGAHPVDRVQFSVGRDLELGPGQDTGPLNYFVYPHVEVADELYDGVETVFNFAELG